MGLDKENYIGISVTFDIHTGRSKIDECLPIVASLPTALHILSGSLRSKRWKRKLPVLPGTSTSICSSDVANTMQNDILDPVI